MEHSDVLEVIPMLLLNQAGFYLGEIAVLP